MPEMLPSTAAQLLHLHADTVCLLNWTHANRHLLTRYAQAPHTTALLENPTYPFNPTHAHAEHCMNKANPSQEYAKKGWIHQSDAIQWEMKRRHWHDVDVSPQASSRPPSPCQSHIPSSHTSHISLKAINT